MFPGWHESFVSRTYMVFGETERNQVQTTMWGVRNGKETSFNIRGKVGASKSTFPFSFSLVIVLYPTSPTFYYILKTDLKFDFKTRLLTVLHLEWEVCSETVDTSLFWLTPFRLRPSHRSSEDLTKFALYHPYWSWPHLRPHHHSSPRYIDLPLYLS